MSRGVYIEAIASDNVNVKKVVFSIDNWVIQGTDESNPFLFDWNTASVKNGEHFLRITAFDTAGNTSSTSIAVTVANSTTGADIEWPTVAFDLPINGATVSNNVPIIARARDNIGVTQVIFTIDNGIVLGADTSTAYSLDWDTTKTKDGNHFLYATAYDAAGHASTTSITVTVSNAPAPPITPIIPIGPDVHKLVKLPDDGNPLTQEDTAIYYIGADNKRHAFPNANVFFSWYCNFSSVTTISASAMAAFSLGKNITYHPGVHMVKFITSPQTYIVTSQNLLRPIANESIAAALYGANWNTVIDDIPDTFFQDYTVGVGISDPTDFNVSNTIQRVLYPSDNMSIPGYTPSTGLHDRCSQANG